MVNLTKTYHPATARNLQINDTILLGDRGVLVTHRMPGVYGESVILDVRDIESDTRGRIMMHATTTVRVHS